MVAGLAAAHGAGVVHRDFQKPTNVMLVPLAGGSGSLPLGGQRFWARPLASTRVKIALTRTGEMLGTPRIHGGPSRSPAKKSLLQRTSTSLGVCDVRNGHWPPAVLKGRNWREGRLPTALRFRRLPPKSMQPDLDPVWADAIQKCMQIAPAEPFSRPSPKSIRPLAGEIDTDLPRRRRKLVRTLMAAGGLILIALVGLFLSGSDFPIFFAWGQGQPSVTVIGFQKYVW